jgi:hypothetical protein
MSDEKRQILNMLAEKKITVDEAERLLNALNDKAEAKNKDDRFGEMEKESSGKKPKYLYVSVKPKKEGDKKGEKVNIRVPLVLLRTGLKFRGILPDSAKEKINKALGDKGIDIKKLDDETFEEMVEGLSKLAIHVDDEDENVSIYCE